MRLIIGCSGLMILFLISPSCFAEEVVKLKGELVFTRCETTMLEKKCAIPFGSGEALEIVLKSTDGLSAPSGSVTFNSEQDGFFVKALISVTNISSGTSKNRHYFIQVFLSSSQMNQPESVSYVNLGNVTVRKMNQLNSISWMGPLLESGSISPTPEVRLQGKKITD
jgi:hypothetical protein